VSASTSGYDELLALAAEVAGEAAELVRRKRREGVDVAGTKSSPVDVVTEADRAAERLIFDRLSAARPGDGFLGEEGASSPTRSGVRWVVDPIDGTVNFLYGIPQYAVSIAATVEGRPVAGVVLDVARDERFTATLGGGAWCDAVRLDLSAADPGPLSQRLVGTGFNYVEAIRLRQAAAVSAMLHEVRDVRRMGAASLDLCSVATGRLDGYVEEGLNPWDVAAGGLVATEAGAVLEELPGVGGTDCFLCAPRRGFEEFRDLVDRCGFLGPATGNRPPEPTGE
jgi:myo-inositol-1(or 4)-monophosphatase